MQIECIVYLFLIDQLHNGIGDPLGDRAFRASGVRAIEISCFVSGQLLTGRVLEKDERIGPFRNWIAPA